MISISTRIALEMLVLSMTEKLAYMRNQDFHATYEEDKYEEALEELKMILANDKKEQSI